MTRINVQEKQIKAFNKHKIKQDRNNSDKNDKLN